MERNVPTLSVDQMRAVDERVVEQYGFTVTRLMEHAGYQVADRVRSGHDADTIHIYAGPGNNGGDGLVAARFLHNWGCDVRVVLAADALEGVPADERAILARLDVPVGTAALQETPDVVVDALLGYGLDGDPRPPFDALIERINEDAPTVSVDVPSGVDADTGDGLQPHVVADETVTLALPKTGLERSDAAGDIYVADIGIPPAVYAEHGVNPRAVEALFAERSLVRVSL